MRVHQCPRCELKFFDEATVKDHLIADHNVEPDQLEQHLPGWSQEHRERRDAPDLLHPERDRR